MKLKDKYNVYNNDIIKLTTPSQYVFDHYLKTNEMIYCDTFKDWRMNYYNRDGSHWFRVTRIVTDENTGKKISIFIPVYCKRIKIEEKNQIVTYFSYVNFVNKKAFKKYQKWAATKNYLDISYTSSSFDICKIMEMDDYVTDDNPHQFYKKVIKESI